VGAGAGAGAGTPPPRPPTAPPVPSPSPPVPLGNPPAPVAAGAAADTTPGNAGAVAGSCFCYCPPGEGYGTCFDVDNATAAAGAAAGGAGGAVGSAAGDAPSDPQCAAFVQRAGEHCPSTGLVRQCGNANDHSCSDGAHDWTAGHMDCSIVTPCAEHPQPFDHLQCTCRPQSYYYCG